MQGHDKDWNARTKPARGKLSTAKPTPRATKNRRASVRVACTAARAAFVPVAKVVVVLAAEQFVARAIVTE